MPWPGTFMKNSHMPERSCGSNVVGAVLFAAGGGCGICARVPAGHAARAARDAIDVIHRMCFFILEFLPANFPDGRFSQPLPLQNHTASAEQVGQAFSLSGLDCRRAYI